MVDVVRRGDTSGEQEPLIDGPILAARGNEDNFNMAAAASRSYQALLKQGITLPAPGAPVPVEYPGGSMLPDPRPGNPTAATGTGDGDSDDAYGEAHEEVAKHPVPSGTHADPRATWSDAGVAGATGSRVMRGTQDPFGFNKPNYPLGPHQGGK